MTEKSTSNKPVALIPTPTTATAAFGTLSNSSTMWANRPVPMKLFGAWEVDKTPPNCIPRLCTLTINRLVLLKPLGSDITTIMIAVKMMSSKRTLRSNEISVPISINSESPSGLVSMDVELDLTFALQYPHFLKKGGNQLQISLQRRKRYKNRAILGFKTLAGAVINMAEVLQRSHYMDKEFELVGNIKDSDRKEILARVVMSTLKSQPVDHEISGLNGRHLKSPMDRSAKVDSDDDVDDFTSNEEGSDSEALEDHTNAGSSAGAGTARERLNQWRRQVNSRKARKLFFTRNLGSEAYENSNVQGRNFKQKFFALLKKFRIPDSEGFDSEEQYHEALEQEFIPASGQSSRDMDDDFFEEEDVDVDEFSDSGQEFDDLSISSTPKPSLKPFFSSCSLIEPDYEAGLNGVKRIESESQDFSGTEPTPDTSDTSLKQAFLDEITNNKKSNNDKEKNKEKKSKLFSKEKSGPNVASSKETRLNKNKQLNSVEKKL